MTEHGDGPIVEVENVSKLFPAGGPPWQRQYVQALSEVSVDVRPGRTLGIVGESGSGKSTLARLMLGLLRPSEGTVRFRGHELARVRGREMQAVRRDMQPVFQDSSSAFNPRQTVRSALLAPLQVHRVGNEASRMERVHATLAEVGLDASFLNRHPHALSGGERQRVAIARALILEPSLIIADEPTSALDVSVQARILNLLKAIQREHQLTYVFVSHNLGVIRHISDEIVVMYLGRIVEAGPIDEVFRAPRHPYTRALLDSIPDPKRRHMGVVRGELPNLASAPSGCAFHPRCPLAMAVCSEERPTLNLVGSDHRAACLWHDRRFAAVAPAELVRERTATTASSGDPLSSDHSAGA